MWRRCPDTKFSREYPDTADSYSKFSVWNCWIRMYTKIQTRPTPLSAESSKILWVSRNLRSSLRRRKNRNPHAPHPLGATDVDD